MVDGKDLEELDELTARARALQESRDPATIRPDDELAEILRDCERLRALAHRSRSKAAEGIRTGRRFLRKLGIPQPSMKALDPDRRPPPLTSLPHTIAYHDPAPGPCAGCGAEVAAGPVGWSRQAGALCEVCFKDRCPPLSLVLYFVNVMRELGEAECHTDEEHWLLAVNLLNSGRLFEADQIASWIPFPSLDPSELERLLATIAYRNATAEEDEEPTGVN